MIYRLILIGWLATLHAFGQNSVAVSRSKEVKHRTATYSNKNTSRAIKTHPYEYYFSNKVKEYEDRMKSNAKKYKKMARLMKKPQYSDPSYFGHKHKPKKRPLDKRKLCKECGIVH